MLRLNAGRWVARGRFVRIRRAAAGQAVVELLDAEPVADPPAGDDCRQVVAAVFRDAVG